MAARAIPVANPFAARPWQRLYQGDRAASPASLVDVLSAFRRVIQRASATHAVAYFDAGYTYGWLDERSDALAVWLAQDCHVARRSHVAILLQNVPDFIVAVLAIWKLGAVPMPLNPMYKQQELGRIFADSGPCAVICHAGAGLVVRAGIAAAGLPPSTPIIAVCPRAHQGRDDVRVIPAATPIETGCTDFSWAVEQRRGSQPEVYPPTLNDIALLLYTSGTTGAPKGAQISHRALAYNAVIASRWCGLRSGGRLFALAPLFHITGFDLHLCASFVTGSSIILTYRFDPDVVLDALVEHRPSFIVGSITAYIALMNVPTASHEHFASLETLYSGGAPIPPAVVERFSARFGKRIRSGFGMTETAGPCHFSPMDTMPTDPASGALSVGIPLPGIDAEIRTDDDCPASVGEAGELVIRGPLLMDGYWNNSEATVEAFTDGWLRTGDVAIMDAEGWFYIVDRKKDMIIASGFKVWPREVEDVLYQFPGVREVAIVGAPDAYRGETVVACVSLASGASVTADEMIAFSRERLAAFKVPRRIIFQRDLPKTVTGKIMRAELRRQVRQTSRQDA
jgi:long-chain acyl-CoA synthetase